MVLHQRFFSSPKNDNESRRRLQTRTTSTKNHIKFIIITIIIVILFHIWYAVVRMYIFLLNIHHNIDLATRISSGTLFVERNCVSDEQTSSCNNLELYEMNRCIRRLDRSFIAKNLKLKFKFDYFVYFNYTKLQCFNHLQLHVNLIYIHLLFLLYFPNFNLKQL